MAIKACLPGWPVAIVLCGEKKREAKKEAESVTSI